MDTTTNFISVVMDMTAPPPAASRSIRTYSARLRVM